MKTAYYTFTTWNDGAMVAGFDASASGPRQGMLTRRPERGSRRAEESAVIDLNAWKAANPELLPEERRDEADWDGGEPEELEEPAPPAPRARRDHRRALLAAELASTLAVAGAAAALMLRVLMF